MSEVKLYVWDARLRDEDYRPATADEIKAAHPKCFTCKDWLYDPKDHSGDVGFCTLYTTESTVDDYCRHHTPKEKT